MSKTFLCSRTEPIVKTPKGLIRGFKLDSTFTFYGIKYANAERWQLPTPVEPWDGVKDALGYGYIAPLSAGVQIGSGIGLIRTPERYWAQNEHCQYLNIWTQHLDPEAKKPVVVWIHGGGFEKGSSLELAAYDGDNLSKFGDVVVVNLNHRLNLLGYMDWSSCGEGFRDSANCGQADLLMALKWVQENITCFGGDPDNVMIFGQSGGGGKITTLLQTPEAMGLFHKAAIFSGLLPADSALRNISAANWEVVVDAILNKLGLCKENAEQLKQMDFYDLARAYNSVKDELAQKGISCSFGPFSNNMYVGHPLEVGIMEQSRDIPVMVCTCFCEFAFDRQPPAKDTIPEEERERIVREKYGANGDQMITLFRQAFPHKNLLDVLSLDPMFRLTSIEYMDARAEVSNANNYLCTFALDFPYNDGDPAWHGGELPYLFHNQDLIPINNIPGVSDKLQEQFCKAFVNFAYHNDPNHDLIPLWKPYTKSNRETMIFDRVCFTRPVATELYEKQAKLYPARFHVPKAK